MHHRDMKALIDSHMKYAIMTWQVPPHLYEKRNKTRSTHVALNTAVGSLDQHSSIERSVQVSDVELPPTLRYTLIRTAARKLSSCPPLPSIEVAFQYFYIESTDKEPVPSAIILLDNLNIGFGYTVRIFTTPALLIEMFEECEKSSIDGTKEKLVKIGSPTLPRAELLTSVDSGYDKSNPSCSLAEMPDIARDFKSTVISTYKFAQIISRYLHTT